MAETSGFFNSVNGDRKYDADFFSQYFADFISNGVYPNPSTMCQILSNNNMTVTEKAGNAYINGQKYKNDGNMILTIEIADGVLNRIDRIVLRHTVLNREIKAYVKKGTFASVPVAPTLQRDADVYEIGLADIYIAAGATSVTQANITDLRLNNSYCGVVHGAVDQVDTTTIFNQYQAWYLETIDDTTTNIAAMLSAFQNSFNSWFSGVQTTLSGDVAGNLLVKINDNSADIAENAANIVSLNTRIGTQERVLTATIPTTGWSGTAPYSVAVNVPGLTDSRPDTNPIYSATLATALLQKESWNKISYIDCTANTMTVYCLEEIPTTAINVELVGG